MVSLQQILTNKQARGAFGEVQLNDLVSNALPPSAYELQCTLSTGVRVDCLLKLPNPPGSIAIDAKFPLESYQLLRAVAAGDAQGLAAAQRAFQAAMRKHISDIRDKYIVPGETAESALLFLPSEAIYAELHANFGGIVDKSYRARVWIVSPTTMMATLNTVRAVLKDVRDARAGRRDPEARRPDDGRHEAAAGAGRQPQAPLHADREGPARDRHLDHADHAPRRAHPERRAGRAAAALPPAEASSALRTGTSDLVLRQPARPALRRK